MVGFAVFPQSPLLQLLTVTGESEAPPAASGSVRSFAALLWGLAQSGEDFVGDGERRGEAVIAFRGKLFSPPFAGRMVPERVADAPGVGIPAILPDRVLSEGAGILLVGASKPQEQAVRQPPTGVASVVAELPFQLEGEAVLVVENQPDPTCDAPPSPCFVIGLPSVTAPVQIPLPTPVEATGNIEQRLTLQPVAPNGIDSLPPGGAPPEIPDLSTVLRALPALPALPVLSALPEVEPEDAGRPQIPNAPVTQDGRERPGVAEIQPPASIPAREIQVILFEPDTGESAAESRKGPENHFSDGEIETVGVRETVRTDSVFRVPAGAAKATLEPVAWQTLTPTVQPAAIAARQPAAVVTVTQVPNEPSSPPPPFDELIARSVVQTPHEQELPARPVAREAFVLSTTQPHATVPHAAVRFVPAPAPSVAAPATTEGTDRPIPLPAVSVGETEPFSAVPQAIERMEAQLRAAGATEIMARQVPVSTAPESVVCAATPSYPAEQVLTVPTGPIERLEFEGQTVVSPRMSATRAPEVVVRAAIPSFPAEQVLTVPAGPIERLEFEGQTVVVPRMPAARALEIVVRAAIADHPSQWPQPVLPTPAAPAGWSGTAAMLPPLPQGVVQPVLSTTGVVQATGDGNSPAPSLPSPARSAPAEPAVVRPALAPVVVQEVGPATTKPEPLTSVPPAFAERDSIEKSIQPELSRDTVVRPPALAHVATMPAPTTPSHIPRVLDSLGKERTPDLPVHNAGIPQSPQPHPVVVAEGEVFSESQTISTGAQQPVRAHDVRTTAVPHTPLDSAKPALTAGVEPQVAQLQMVDRPVPVHVPTGHAGHLASPIPETGSAAESAPPSAWRQPSLPNGVTPDAIVRQVVQRITTAQSIQRTELSIRLEPPQLGHVTLRIVHSDRRVVAEILTPHEAVRDVLERQLPELRQALEHLGVRTETITVRTSAEPSLIARPDRPDGQPGRSPQHPESQQDPPNGNGRRPAHDEQPPDQHARRPRYWWA